MTFLKYLRELFTIQPNYNCNDFFWTLTQITCDSFFLFFLPLKHWAHFFSNIWENHLTFSQTKMQMISFEH